MERSNLPPGFAGNLADSYVKARRELAEADPLVLAGSAGVDYQSLAPSDGEFRVPYFGETHVVRFPEATVWRGDVPASPMTQIILLHYLLTADGTRSSGQWITFRQLPNAFPYDRAFMQRAIMPLIQTFGNDLEGFVRAGVAAGGEPSRTADASFFFRALPQLPMMLQLWAADEDMPASANVLFDSNAGHQLPTEDLSGLGGTLSQRIIRAARQPQS